MNRDRIEAVMRLLMDSGDMTPMAQRQIQNVMDAEGSEHRQVEEVSISEFIQIVITDEGIILDAFNGDEHLGTVGRTFDEWFQYVKGQ